MVLFFKTFCVISVTLRFAPRRFVIRILKRCYTNARVCTHLLPVMLELKVVTPFASYHQTHLDFLVLLNCRWLFSTVCYTVYELGQCPRSEGWNHLVCKSSSWNSQKCDISMAFRYIYANRSGNGNKLLKGTSELTFCMGFISGLDGGPPMPVSFSTQRLG